MKDVLKVLLLLICLFVVVTAFAQTQERKTEVEPGTLFETSDKCMACHNSLTAPSGEDISIGSSWRGSMMANSARDPYWQASVRREVMDHPESKLAIEDECAKCHMPMVRFEAKTSGQKAGIFEHLPFESDSDRNVQLAEDGVSCTVCHQITDKGLGLPNSFTGNFEIDTSRSRGEREIYGPFEIDKGRTRIMRSATGFKQTESLHVRKSELCATCHTLFTHALGPGGQPQGELPEQTPYQEWLHSRYREEKSCQDCHMPVVSEPTPITSVLGEPRERVARHNFQGGNFFVLQMLHRFRGELGVRALPQELELGSRTAREHLQTATARITLERPTIQAGQLDVNVAVANLSGHKLPTAYPSRRAWIRFVVRDSRGSVVFESGGISPTGAIQGNDNDADPLRFEPHHLEIRSANDVQIYESVMADRNGAVTTGLLSAVRYLKDNRLLPDGFEKSTAEPAIAVHGAAAGDSDFSGGSDRVRFLVDVSSAQGPFSVTAELWFQPIAYRWAENLRGYDAPETTRFVGYYQAMSASSATLITQATAVIN